MIHGCCIAFAFVGSYMCNNLPVDIRAVPLNSAEITLLSVVVVRCTCLDPLYGTVLSAFGGRGSLNALHKNPHNIHTCTYKHRYTERHRYKERNRDGQNTF